VPSGSRVSLGIHFWKACLRSGISQNLTVPYIEPESNSLAGTLLLAHPSMRDENFEQAIIFVSINDAEDGSFGVILNRPSGRRLNELLPDEDLDLLAMAPVYQGGPVATDQLLMVAFRWIPDAENSAGGSWSWRHDLNLESARAVVEDEGAILRVFEGYTGWSKGQLENELRRNIWVVHEPDSTLLDPDAQMELWRNLVRTHGPLFKFLTEAPENLGNN
jgi:putative transcriptional regulator